MLEGYHWDEREKRVVSVLRRDMVGVVGLLGWCRVDESWTHSMVPVVFFFSLFFRLDFDSRVRRPPSACLLSQVGDFFSHGCWKV